MTTPRASNSAIRSHLLARLSPLTARTGSAAWPSQPEPFCARPGASRCRSMSSNTTGISSGSSFESRACRTCETHSVLSANRDQPLTWHGPAAAGVHLTVAACCPAILAACQRWRASTSSGDPGMSVNLDTVAAALPKPVTCAGGAPEPVTRATKPSLRPGIPRVPAAGRSTAVDTSPTARTEFLAILQHAQHAQCGVGQPPSGHRTARLACSAFG